MATSRPRGREQVTFLDQIQQGQPTIAVALADRDDQTQVGLGEIAAEMCLTSRMVREILRIGQDSISLETLADEDGDS